MRKSFKEWWNRPIKPADRFYGAVVGAFGGFWVLLLGRLFLGPMPISFVELANWALAGVTVGIVLGIFYPRIIMVVLYPFTLIGFGSD